MIVLQLYHLILIACIVKYKFARIAQLKDLHPDWSGEELERAVPELGIAELWGNKEPLVRNDKVVTWLTTRGKRVEEKVVPGGAVNGLIIDNKLGAPLLYPKQFYRLAETLEKAGWLLGGDFKFVHRDNAELFVSEFLNHMELADWPTYVPVYDGVPQLNEIRPKLPVSLIGATMEESGTD